MDNIKNVNEFHYDDSKHLGIIGIKLRMIVYNLFAVHAWYILYPSGMAAFWVNINLIFEAIWSVNEVPRGGLDADGIIRKI